MVRDVKVQDVVACLDIDEYLTLPPGERDRVNALLGPMGARTISADAVHRLIDLFGADSATAAALACRA